MKTLNFELSKKLNDLGLLDNIETEYGYYKNINGEWIVVEGQIDYKTLTLEEAIEFIKRNLVGIRKLKLNIKENFEIIFEFKPADTTTIIGHTLLEAIEKMIEYLLDKNLLGKNNI